MTPKILFIICVDADPDRPEYGGTRYDVRSTLRWELLPKLGETITQLREYVFRDSGMKFRVTWFIRADAQIESICRHFVILEGTRTYTVQERFQDRPAKPDGMVHTTNVG